MHWANLRAVDSCSGLSFALKEPGGCSSLHAPRAFFHSAGLTLIPKDGNLPDAFGSGKSLTPFARMHALNFTALPRAVRLLFPPVPVLLAVSVLLAVRVAPAGPAVLVPPLLRVPPQPALITASMARAASGRSVLVTGSLLVHRHRFSAGRALGAELLG